MQIIRKTANYEETINKSKFISYSYHISSEEDANEIIKSLWKEHRKATHICTAYRYGVNEIKGIYNDDGEPALTAGRVILNELEVHNITNTLICVVRYFGGIKLGKGGLIRAYSSLAKGVIEASLYAEVYRVKKVFLKLNYTSYQKLINYIEKHRLIIDKQSFEEGVTLSLYLKEEQQEDFFRYIKAELYRSCDIIDQMGKVITIGKTIEELEE